MPRSPTVIDGMLPSKNPVSLMIATSAASPLAVRLEPSRRGGRCSIPPRPRRGSCTLTGSAAGRGEERLRGAEMHVDLALVVRRAAAEHPAVAGDRLERRRLPELDRVDGLDVVVAVDQRRRLAGGVEPVAVDDRMAAGLGDLDVLEPDPPHVRRRSTRPPRGSRRRAPAAPRCSGCAGRRGTTRGDRRRGRRARRRRRDRWRRWSWMSWRRWYREAPTGPEWLPRGRGAGINDPGPWARGRGRRRVGDQAGAGLGAGWAPGVGWFGPTTAGGASRVAPSAAGR